MCMSHKIGIQLEQQLRVLYVCLFSFSLRSNGKIFGICVTDTTSYESWFFFTEDRSFFWRFQTVACYHFFLIFVFFVYYYLSYINVIQFFPLLSSLLYSVILIVFVTVHILFLFFLLFSMLILFSISSTYFSYDSMLYFSEINLIILKTLSTFSSSPESIQCD